MNDDTREHMKSWGVPDEYCDLYPTHVPHEYAHLARAIASAANWYREQDGAVAEMIRRKDAEALRSWDRQCLVVIGTETAMDDSPTGEEYADAIMEALADLADELAEEGA